jgi:hypothetical protein
MPEWSVSTVIDRKRRAHRLGTATALIAVAAAALMLASCKVNGTTGHESGHGSTNGSPTASTGASASASSSASASAQPSASASKSATATPTKTGGNGGNNLPPISKDWPSSANTGTPAGVTLKDCATTITKSATYDACRFNGGVLVQASNVKITRSLILGDVNAGSGSQQSGLVISDTTINCKCPADNSHTPAAIQESNYTLLRVNLYGSGHGAAVKNNVVIQDSYIHGLGANTEAHKDGIFAGDGTNVTIRHNNIECNDGSAAGCTSAIGLLTDFGDISYYTIDHNLLNTVGSYCFYGSGGPQKSYSTHHITFTNNHFGRSIYPKCGFYGPVTYFDMKKPGMVWSGNVWDDSGQTVSADY